MTDGEAIELIRAWEYRRQNAAAEHFKGALHRREVEFIAQGRPQLACGCLAFSEGDYVRAYEWAKDR